MKTPLNNYEDKMEDDLDYEISKIEGELQLASIEESMVAFKSIAKEDRSVNENSGNWKDDLDELNKNSLLLGYALDLIKDYEDLKSTKYYENLSLEEKKKFDLTIERAYEAAYNLCLARIKYADARDSMYYSQGNYKMALEMYTEVLGIKKKSYGHEHPSIAETINNIVSIGDSQASLAQNSDIDKLAIEAPISASDSHDDSPKPNSELTSIALSVRDNIELLPMYKYFIEEIIYPLTKGMLPTWLKNAKIPEINPYFLVAMHLRASHVAAYELGLESPLKAAIEVSSPYYFRIFMQEFLGKLDNINLAAYCTVNAATYFVPEILELTGKTPAIKPKFGYAEKYGMSVLGCYNAYKSAHEQETKTNTDQVIPYIADLVTAAISLGISHDPFYLLGNVVMVDVVSKQLLKAIPTDFKVEYIDPVINCLGYAEIPEHNL